MTYNDQFYMNYNMEVATRIIRIYFVITSIHGLSKVKVIDENNRIIEVLCPGSGKLLTGTFVFQLKKISEAKLFVRASYSRPLGWVGKYDLFKWFKNEGTESFLPQICQNPIKDKEYSFDEFIDTSKSFIFSRVDYIIEHIKFEDNLESYAHNYIEDIINSIVDCNKSYNNIDILKLSSSVLSSFCKSLISEIFIDDAAFDKYAYKIFYKLPSGKQTKLDNLDNNNFLLFLNDDKLNTISAHLCGGSIPVEQAKIYGVISLGIMAFTPLFPIPLAIGITKLIKRNKLLKDKPDWVKKFYNNANDEKVFISFVRIFLYSGVFNGDFVLKKYGVIPFIDNYSKN